MPKKLSKSNRVDTLSKKSSFDKPFLYTTLTLFIVGFLVLSSASMALADKKYGSFFYYTLGQLKLGGTAGLVSLFIFQMIPYRHWKRAALPLMVVSFILLALVFTQIGYGVGNTHRWIKLGSINFQPSEILKLGFIVYLASWLDARRKDVRSFSYGIMPFALMVSIVGIFLMMQRDFGTFGVIAATAGLLYFLGGGKISQMGGLAGLGLAACFFIVKVLSYGSNRVHIFFNPSFDPKGIGYQINQALIAIGSGGFWGLGFGRSLQKYNYLPEPMTDSIFAIFAEEMGFIGILMLFTIFGFFFWRAFIIAKHAPDVFGRLLAMGLIIGIMVQAFINMAAISGFLPLTGITLPFISYGGTSLAITMAMTGIILNISKYR